MDLVRYNSYAPDLFPEPMASTKYPTTSLSTLLFQDYLIWLKRDHLLFKSLYNSSIPHQYNLHCSFLIMCELTRALCVCVCVAGE